VIRPDGTVESTIGLFTAGYRVADVPLLDSTTPGTVLGAPIRWVLTVACPLALFGALVISRRRTSRPGA
jgi:apolipoprotein N-acyltransferase